MGPAVSFNRSFTNKSLLFQLLYQLVRHAIDLAANMLDLFPKLVQPVAQLYKLFC